MTSTGMMTPECASPEQVRGDAVTTATDIYSLGVLLYQLLTGSRPYEFKLLTQEEIRRVVCFEEPTKPSQVASLSRDLDNIVLKAMRKDPAGRYASAQQLSEDIKRHLAGLPVLARKATLGYQLSKFVQRQKAATTATVLVLASLITGITAALWQSHLAREERTRAEFRFNQVRKLANSLMLDIDNAIKDLPGSLSARKLLVERALQYLDSLARESADDPTLQRELAASYERVGLVQGGTAYGSFGDSDAALQSLRKALIIRRSLNSSKVCALQDRLALARLLDIMGRLFRARGDFKSALAFHREALAGVEAAQKTAPTDRQVLAQLETSYDALGDLLSSCGNGGSLGKEQEATELHRKALNISRYLLKLNPNDLVSNRSFAISLVKVSDDFKKDGQRREALSAALEARDILLRLSVAHPANATLRRLTAGSYSTVGDIQLWNGDDAGSLASYTKALAITRSAAQTDPKNQQSRFDYADCAQGVGYAQMHMGHLQDAKRHFEIAEQISQAAVTAAPKDAVAKDVLAYSEADLGELYGREHKPALAIAEFQKARSIWGTLAAVAPTDVEARLKMASVENRITGILLRIGRTEEASAVFRSALARAEPPAIAGFPDQ